MSRADRAKQFAPFDALKGLHDALKIKEYQHDKILRGEMTEEKAAKLSKTLINLQKGDVVKIFYFDDDHEKSVVGTVKLLADENALQIEKTKISLDLVDDIEMVESH